jgi:hypothetical protein
MEEVEVIVYLIDLEAEEVVQEVLVVMVLFLLVVQVEQVVQGLVMLLQTHL